MTPLRFLLDEHVPHAIQSQLLRLDADIDVLVVGQPSAPPRGTSDSDILAWIEKTGYVLVTANRRTIPECMRAHYAAGRCIPGILPAAFLSLSKGLWRRTLTGNLLFLWRVLKQRTGLLDH
jgi:hypothetical protein